MSGQSDFSYIQALRTKLIIYPEKELENEVIIKNIEEDMWRVQEDKNTFQRQIPLGSDEDEVSRMGTLTVDTDQKSVSIKSRQPVDSRLLYHSVKDYLNNWEINNTVPMTSLYYCIFSHPLVSFDEMIQWGNFNVRTDDGGMKYINRGFGERKSVRLYESSEMFIVGGSSIELANEALKMLNNEITKSIFNQNDALNVDGLPDDWYSPMSMIYPTKLIEQIVWNWGETISKLNNQKIDVGDIFTGEYDEITKSDTSLMIIDVMLSLLHSINIISNENKDKFYDTVMGMDDSGQNVNVFVDFLSPIGGDQIPKDEFIQNRRVLKELQSELFEKRSLLQLVLKVVDGYDEYDETISVGDVFEVHGKDGNDIAVQINNKDTVSELDLPHESVWWGRITTVKNKNDCDKIGQEIILDPNDITNKVSLNKQ